MLFVQPVALPTKPIVTYNHFNPSGPPEDGPRAIFSVDLWHPNVAAAERQALDFIFNPDL